MSPSITSRTRRSGSGPKSLAMSANAPSGTLRADAVPTIQCRRALRGPHARRLRAPAASCPPRRSRTARSRGRGQRRPAWPRRSPQAPPIARPVATGGSPANSNRHRLLLSLSSERTIAGAGEVMSVAPRAAAASLASATRMNVGSVSRSTPTQFGDHLVGNPGIPQPQRGRIRQRQPLQGLGPARIHRRSLTLSSASGWRIRYPNPEPTPRSRMQNGSCLPQLIHILSFKLSSGGSHNTPAHDVAVDRTRGSRHGNAKCIGRVGALAVALGSGWGRRQCRGRLLPSPPAPVPTRVRSDLDDPGLANLAISRRGRT